MPLKRTSYIDGDGRKKAVFLPDSENDANASIGIPIGPPDLSELGLPLETEVRLNNELFYRGIFTAQDAIRKRAEVLSAIQTALKLGTEQVVALYAGKDYRNARREAQPPKTVVKARIQRRR